MTLNPLTTLGVDGIGQQIIAIGALGTAAYGLVDVSKAVRGGISNRGFGFIRSALEPFDTALTQALGTDCDWRALMRSHWINGRPKEEQKAIAVSLIQLGLTAETAPVIAPAGQVTPEALGKVVTALTNGAELAPDELNVLGRFKATIEARIDAAYERGDQVYRTTARFAAGFVAVMLAVAALWVTRGDSATPLGTKDYLAAIIVGLVAVPLAPIARDVASALSTAARALRRRSSG